MKLKGLLIMQWERALQIIIIRHMVFFEPKDFKERNFKLKKLNYNL